MGLIHEEALICTRCPNALRYEMNINLGEHVKITVARYFSATLVEIYNSAKVVAK